MSNLVLNNNGATITITNVSNTTAFEVANGFISPTLVNRNLNETNELPTFKIQIPSFMSYKYNYIQPGDSITFECTNNDEILYYYNISKNPFSGISVTVVPNGGGSSVLIDKTITANGVYSATDDDADGYSTVTIDVPSTIITSGDRSGVIIMDYDGSVIASYSKEQFAALASYPTQPTHTGLIGQGYNWSLSDAKDYVAEYDYLEIGATYITDDGKTRYYITTTSVNEEISFNVIVDGIAIVDWGDGSEIETLRGDYYDTTSEHTYNNIGRYVITIEVIEDRIVLSKAPPHLYKVEVGSNVTSINRDTFSYCEDLTYVSIPNSVTSIGHSAFYCCFSLRYITVPNSITSIDIHTFAYCHAMASITLPNTITSMGSDIFLNCFSLRYITIPNSVTSMGSSVFIACNSMHSVTIPNSVASIGNSVFYENFSLDSVKLSNQTTYLGTQMFYFCTALLSIKFTSITPPTAESETFEYINTFCTIYVPRGTLEAYTTAPNYPDPAVHTYIEYD